MNGNILPASEIKRRGMAAIEESLRNGPVSILKRNKPAAVVLSEADYQRLLAQGQPVLPAVTALQWLLAQRSAGDRKRAEIDADLQAQRAG